MLTWLIVRWHGKLNSTRSMLTLVPSLAAMVVETRRPKYSCTAGILNARIKQRYRLKKTHTMVLNMYFSIFKTDRQSLQYFLLIHFSATKLHQKVVTRAFFVTFSLYSSRFLLILHHSLRINYSILLYSWQM